MKIAPVLAQGVGPLMHAETGVGHAQATEERRRWTWLWDCGRCTGDVYQGSAYTEAVRLLIKSSLVVHACFLDIEVEAEVEVEPSLSLSGCCQWLQRRSSGLPARTF